MISDQALSQIQYNNDGLVPAIAQDAATGKILMMAWMSEESLRLTVSSGYAVYWSRSRSQLWKKGETSGHQQAVKALCLDCDGDTILLQVEQKGGIACHTGRESCFFYTLKEDGEWRENSEPLKSSDDIYGDKK